MNYLTTQSTIENQDNNLSTQNTDPSEGVTKTQETDQSMDYDIEDDIYDKIDDQESKIFFKSDD